MSLFQAILFGIVQGIGEFLPISSSGHLQVLKHIFNLENIPVLFDILLHIATLIAVFIIFYKDIRDILVAIWRFLIKKTNSKDKENLKLFIDLIIITIITLIVVLLMKTKDQIENADINMVYRYFIVTGIILLFASMPNPKRVNLNIVNILFIGIAQGIATLPGISRSGSCITAGVLTGLKRKETGRVTFLISIPAILGSLLLTLKDSSDLSLQINFNILLAGMLSAMVFGILSLSFLTFIIKTKKLWIFSIYLFALGGLGLFGYIDKIFIK